MGIKRKVFNNLFITIMWQLFKNGISWGLTLSTLISKFKFSFVFPIHFHGCGGEKLLKFQTDSSCLIISLILVTNPFY